MKERRDLQSFLIISIRILVFLVCSQRVCCARSGGSQYRTAYSCEGKQLSIECENGHLIHLIRANYGRFSISICNDHGNLDWSVDCTSHRSYYVIHERCSRMSSCSVSVSSATFGDPCPGTFKYLEVQYRCILESTTTSSTTTRLSTTTTTTSTPPPIIIPLTRLSRTSTSTTPSTVSSSTTLSPVSTAKEVPYSTSKFDLYTTTTATSQTHLPITIKLLTTTTRWPQKSSVTPPPYSVVLVEATASTGLMLSGEQTTRISDVPMCAPTFSRNLLWNWTEPGKTATQKCPGGASGEAVWLCAANPVPRWTPDSPDLSQCTSYPVDNLRDQIERGTDSVFNIASELAQLTDTSSLHGGDVIHIADILQKIVSSMDARTRDFPDESHRLRAIKELLESLLQISSHLLDTKQREAWRDLPPTKQRYAASALLQAMEFGGWLMAERQNNNRYHFSRAQENVLLSVRLLDVWTVSEVTFPVPEDVEGTSWKRMGDSLVLPAQAALGNAHQGVVKVVFLAFNQIEDFLGYYGHLDPELPTPGGTPRDPKAVQIVNSRVLSATIDAGREARLLEPVSLTFRHLQVDNVSNPVCVFWDLNSRSWSASGCQLRMGNSTHTVCACNHLTSFALLMDLSSSQLKDQMLLTLQMVVYVGCAVAMFFLLLTVVVLIGCRSVKGDRAVIHKNLTVCLLLIEVLYIAGASQTSAEMVCAIVAGLIHFFLLSAFGWLLLDSFNIYVMVGELFETAKNRFKWYYVLTYGTAAAVVGIAAGIEPGSYGSKRHCWIRVDKLYVLSLVGPTAACIVGSLFFLLLVLCRICCRPSGKNKAQAKLQTAKAWSRRAAVVLLAVSCCWAVALLHVHLSTLLTGYLFTAANGLQGLVVFVAFCVKNEKVRKSIQKCLRRAEWLPECLRQAKVGESRPSLYVHSNGVVTLPSSTCGSDSLPQLNWSTSKQLLSKGSTQQTSVTPGLLSTTNTEHEECALQNWRPNTAYSTSRILQDCGPPRLLDFGTSPASGRYPDVYGDMPSGQSRSRVPSTYGKRRKMQERIYETVDDDDDDDDCDEVTSQRLDCHLDVPNASQRVPATAPVYDPCTTWERRSSGRTGHNDSKLFASLTAAFTDSPPRQLSLLREGCFRPQLAYSGVPSPTDSERSSSSLMVDRISSSPSVSPEAPRSPVYATANGEYLQSMPNLPSNEGAAFTAFSHVLKYPSDNAVEFGPSQV